VQRGNRRQAVFFRDEDYLCYLTLMKEWCEKEKVEIWAYCLMPNHVHLVAVPARTRGLAAAIGEAHRRYTRLINFREDWRGYLWQGRFASYPMDDEYLPAVLRYAEWSPVRAGLATNPGDYRWSSARAHLENRDDMLVKGTTLQKRMGDWTEFLRQDAPGLEQDLIERCLRTGRPLGDRRFVAALEKRLRRALWPQKPGPKPQ
jgi:putative transposase